MGCVRNLIIHTPMHMDAASLANKVDALHVELVRRKLKQSSLTAEQKVKVIDIIIDDLHQQEVTGALT